MWRETWERVITKHLQQDANGKDRTQYHTTKNQITTFPASASNITINGVDVSRVLSMFNRDYIGEIDVMDYVSNSPSVVTNIDLSKKKRIYGEQEREQSEKFYKVSGIPFGAFYTLYGNTTNHVDTSAKMRISSVYADLSHEQVIVDERESIAATTTVFGIVTIVGLACTVGGFLSIERNRRN